jgi:L-aminopeptidase/D-esterase-like protein
MREKKGLRGTLLSNCLMIIPLVLSGCGGSIVDNQQSKNSSMQFLSSDSQKKKDAFSSENGSYKEIKVTEVGDIMIGQTENTEAGTGLTVFISKDGMPAGLDVRGGGPASRESELLDPLAAAQKINAIVLSGGSAFGLGAGDGVMEYLEKKKIGYDTGYAIVPLVVQSDLYDLSVGDSKVRPDAKMGYEAAKNAFENPNYKDGNYGAGCGATVGKIAGMDTCMKSGIGSYAIQIGELKIGAVVAVNALGDIYDWKTGKKIAGLLAEDKRGFRDTLEYMARDISTKDKFTGNTTLGVIITNASFEKSQLCKIAGMAHDGYARSIRPVHTTADGDSIYAVSAGSVAADQDLVGSFAALVMSEAINRAVMSAETAYGFVSASDLAGRDG